MSAGAGQSGRPYPYTPKPPTAAGEKLDRFLTEAITDLGAKNMPDEKPAIGSLAEAMQAVTAAAYAVKAQAIKKAIDMRDDIEANGALVMKKLDDVHQQALSDMSAVLGNERAGDV